MRDSDRKRPRSRSNSSDFSGEDSSNRDSVDVRSVVLEGLGGGTNDTINWDHDWNEDDWTDDIDHSSAALSESLSASSSSSSLLSSSLHHSSYNQAKLVMVMGGGRKGDIKISSDDIDSQGNISLTSAKERRDRERERRGEGDKRPKSGSTSANKLTKSDVALSVLTLKNTLLGAVLHLNRLSLMCKNPLLISIVYSLCPSSFLSGSLSTNPIASCRMLLPWFHSTFTVSDNEFVSWEGGLSGFLTEESITSAFSASNDNIKRNKKAKKKENNPIVLSHNQAVQIFAVLLRLIGINCRIVCAIKSEFAANVLEREDASSTGTSFRSKESLEEDSDNYKYISAAWIEMLVIDHLVVKGSDKMSSPASIIKNNSMAYSNGSNNSSNNRSTSNNNSGKKEVVLIDLISDDDNDSFEGDRQPPVKSHNTLSSSSKTHPKPTSNPTSADSSKSVKEPPNQSIINSSSNNTIYKWHSIDIFRSLIDCKNDVAMRIASARGTSNSKSKFKFLTIFAVEDDNYIEEITKDYFSNSYLYYNNHFHCKIDDLIRSKLKVEAWLEKLLNSAHGYFCLMHYLCIYSSIKGDSTSKFAATIAILNDRRRSLKVEGNIKDKIETENSNEVSDEKRQEYSLNTAEPKTLADYKNHAKYALPRFLLHNEVLHPTKAKVVRMFRGEMVYLREHVEVCYTKLQWIKRLRQIIPDEKPMKRYKSKNGKGEVFYVELFGQWQTTELLRPPPLLDETLPVNEHGTMDVWEGCEAFIPQNTSLITLPWASKAAKSLNINFAPAVFGFDHSNAYHTTAKIGGIVVMSRYKGLIESKCKEVAAEKEELARNRKFARVITNWERLVLAVRNRQYVKDTYGY